MKVLNTSTAVTDVTLLWLKLTVDNVLSREAIAEERYLLPYKRIGSP